MLETINEIFSQKFFDDFEKVETLLFKYSELVDQIGSKSIKDLGLKELAQATTALSRANQSLTNAYKALERQNAATTRTTNQSANSNLQAARTAEALARQELALARAQEVRERTTIRANNASTRSAAANNIASDSLKAMSRDLDSLRRGYNLLTKSERENAEIGGVLLARIRELDAALRTSDASMGQFGRNVGNYSSALSGFQFSVRNIAGELPNLAISLRTFGMAISNNIQPAILAFQNLRAENARLRAEGQATIPVWSQIGKSFFSLSTLLPLVIVAGFKLVEYLTKNKSAAELAEEANKKYKDSLKSIEESSRSATQEDIARLHVLTAIARDTTQEMRNRLRAVKELQETYPSMFKNLSQQAILEGQLENALNRTTEALLQRASAQAAEKKFAAAGERVYDLTLAIRQQYDEVVKAEAKLQRRPGIRPVAFAKFEFERNLEKQKEKLNDLTNQMIKARAEQQGFLKDALEASKLAGDTNFGKETTPKVKDTSARDLRRLQNERDRDRSAELAAEKELSDAKRDLENQTIEQQIQGLKLIYENEALGLDQRLEAYGNYVSKRQQQLEANKTKELADIVSLEKQIDEVRQRSVKERSQADQDLLLRAEGIATRRKVIEAKTEAEILELRRKAYQETNKILESSSDFYMKEIQNRLRIIREGEDEALRITTSALGKQLRNREITLKEYDYRVKKAETDSLEESLRRQVIALQYEVDTVQLSADARAKLEKNLADLKAKLNAEDVKNTRLTEDEKIKLTQKRRDAALAAASQITQATFDIAGYQYDEEVKALEEKSRLLDENLKKEIEGIKARGLAQKEEEKEIADAKGQAAALEASYEADRRKAIIARARTEKGAKIASIILTTAQAVIQAFAEGDPFTKGARAAAAGIAGATQLAIAAATPIPAYAEGTGHQLHPGGAAIINDNKKFGNEAELVQEPGKKPYWADFGTDTLVNLPKGTAVTPLHKLINNAQHAAIEGLAHSGKKVTENSYLEALLQQVDARLAVLNKTVKDKPEFKFQGTIRGFDAIRKTGNAIDTILYDISH